MYVFISDIHLGVKIPEDVFNDCLEEIFEIINKSKEECRQIFVCGDLFDRKLNTHELEMAARFIVKLVCNGWCSDGSNIGVTFIHGTYSHDQEQYKIFIPLIERITGVAIRYIDKACSFRLDNGETVLALPQEYGDIDYDKLFSHNYDIIIGHGPMSSGTKSPCPVGNSEILMSADLLGKISKICVFGHYHEYTDFGNNVYYTGSMLRWRYGEPSQKVFFTCDNNFKVTTYPNPFAVEFKIVECDSVDYFRQEVSKEITSPHRFVIHCRDDKELDEVHAIVNVYKKNKNISVRIISEKKEIKPVEDTPKLSTQIEPIPALISYIRDKYLVDTAPIIKEYENKIRMKEGDQS